MQSNSARGCATIATPTRPMRISMGRSASLPPPPISNCSPIWNNETFAEISAACTLNPQQCALPNKLTYTTGPLPAIANVFDAALFFQDDWKVNHNLTASAGVRWESQNHISDHNDW